MRFSVLPNDIHVPIDCMGMTVKSRFQDLDLVDAYETEVWPELAVVSSLLLLLLPPAFYSWPFA